MSHRAFTFAHGVNPETGEVTDVHSDIEGQNVKGRVIFYPYGKGSTTASAWFLETARLGNAPAGVVTETVDTAVVIGAILAQALYGVSIPVLSASLPQLETGKTVRVDGASGRIDVVL
ncbi:MAG TPA: DUF126 domain-containing protein [Nitrososphaerales archaeon]|nr:DUF126 domain-containing protein [Nitrososphaerales archaeon]